MRHIPFILCFFCGISLAKPAPNFSLESSSYFTNSNTKTLKDLRGKVVYIDFWASWCKPCRKSFPWMNRIQTKYSNQGFQIIAINLDQEPELVELFLQNNPTSFPIVLNPNGSIAKDYQLLGMPSSYLIDAKGEIRFAHKGFFDKNTAAYEQEIQTLLQEIK